MGSDIPYSIQKREHASVRPDGTEAESNVDPFAFWLVALAGSKSLENLESLGGMEGLLHGLGTDRLRGLSTKLPGRSHRGPPDPAVINALAPYGVEKTQSTSPTGVPVSEGLQSAASLAGSGVQSSASFKFSAEASIEGRQRIYGHNILPQPPRKCLLQLMWLAFHDKVIVSAKISLSSRFLRSDIRLTGFLIDCRRSIACPGRLSGLPFGPARRGDSRAWGSRRCYHRFHPCCCPRWFAEQLAKGETVYGAQSEERTSPCQGHPRR